jgi:dienelactone hydrolase
MHSLVLLVALAADPTPDDPATRAGALVTTLSRGEFAAAIADFDETMRKVLPAERLKAVWESVTKQFGPYQKQLGTRTETKDKLQVVFVTCQFEKRPLDVRVVFNAENRVSGLQFLPSKPAVEYKSPAYVQKDKFTEKDVLVGAGSGWELPGTLTMPAGTGPFPALVLLHGSGPHDRDESIGPNRPFRDLADGLASRGIAVLRYEKRTRQHSAKMADGVVTVREEVLDDALAAVELLRKTPGIDPKRVYVLGHSLGGMMAPKLATLDAKLAGVIVMAGPTRPLEDLMVEQFTYIAKLGGEADAVVMERLAKIKEQAAKVKDPKLSVETPASGLPFGVPAAYWLSFRGYDPAAVAAGLAVPVLVLHADRDYQVPLTDYEGWQKALGGKLHATLKRYATLNHLFMDGEGKSTPAEYEKEGHVAAAVIEDIAAWVRKPK